MSQARETQPCSGSMGSTCWLTVGLAAERAFGTLAATWTGKELLKNLIGIQVQFFRSIPSCLIQVGRHIDNPCERRQYRGNVRPPPTQDDERPLPPDRSRVRQLASQASLGSSGSLEDCHRRRGRGARQLTHQRDRGGKLNATKPSDPQPSTSGVP